MQQIKYDPIDDQFFIEKSTGYGANEKFERLPLSTWGLVKQITVYAHITRKIESTEFENPLQLIHYKLPITYTIMETDLGKNIYLKLTEKLFDVPIRENVRANWKSVMMRDVNTGVVQECPLPNSMYSQDAFPFLLVSKGKATELSINEVCALWSSGLCIGSYDFKLENRLI